MHGTSTQVVRKARCCAQSLSTSRLMPKRASVRMTGCVAQSALLRVLLTAATPGNRRWSSALLHCRRRLVKRKS